MKRNKRKRRKGKWLSGSRSAFRVFYDKLLPTGNRRLITSWFAFCDLSDNLSWCMHSLVASQALRHTKWLGRTLWAYSPAGRTKENELVRRARDEIASLWLCARTSSFKCMHDCPDTRVALHAAHTHKDKRKRELIVRRVRFACETVMSCIYGLIKRNYNKEIYDRPCKFLSIFILLSNGRSYFFIISF